MFEYPDEKSIQICNYVDRMIPVTADAEINFALKKYYLGLEYNEEEVQKIIKKREDDLKIMMEQLILTSYNDLDKPHEEDDIITMKSTNNINVETSDNSIVQGHENN